jgi:Tfp pilus assembly protein PilF
MPDDLFNRGLSFSQGGHFQQAEQYLQSALLFNPRDQETLLLLAQVQALRGNRPAATATFARVLEKGINDPRLQNIAVILQAAIGSEVTDKPVETAVVAHSQPSQPSQPPAKSEIKKHKHRRKRH